MIILNSQNVGEIIFSDKNLKDLLPEDEKFFDAWRLSLVVPAMRQVGKKAVIDFLGQITEDQIKTISGYLGDEVTVERLDPSVVKSLTVPLGNVENLLNQVGAENVLCINRNKEEVKICL